MAKPEGMCYSQLYVLGRSQLFLLFPSNYWVSVQENEVLKSKDVLAGKAGCSANHISAP